MGDARPPETPETGRSGDPRAVAVRLAKLPEPRMRAMVLRELLMEIPPSEAAWLLDALATAGRAGGPPFDVSLLAAVDLASGDDLPYETRRRIFEAADQHRLDSCKELLFTPDLGPVADEAAAPRALVPGTRPLTLGERKSLARSWRRDALERLLLDPHVDVVKLLLDNSRVTEDDVLRLATARRATAPALNLVMQHKRWNRRPRVRKALLRNPRLPSAAAVRLVGLLNRSDQKEIASDPKTPLIVLAAVRRRLAPLD